MRDKTLLALALLLALSLPGLAAAAGDPLRLSAAAAPSAPLALCAAAPAAAPQGLPPSLATQLGAGTDALTCSSDCSTNTCLGATPGDYCGAYPKDGRCNMTATLCSADGRYRCYCKLF